MKSLPILSNHDPSDVLGQVIDDGVVQFRPRTMTLETLVAIGGGWRLLTTETHDGVSYVTRAQLMCLSTTAPTDVSRVYVPVQVADGSFDRVPLSEFATLEHYWREFLAAHPEVRAMTAEHVNKIKTVWLDGVQAVLMVVKNRNPEGPKTVSGLQAALAHVNDESMAAIAKAYGREN